MGKSLYIRILLPIAGFREDRIYDENEVQEAGLSSYYGCLPEGKFAKKLKVRSEYAAMSDIVRYMSEKYGLGEIKNYSISYWRDTMDLHANGETYSITKREADAQKKEHVDEGTYCQEYRSFDVEVYSGVLEELVPDSPVPIDNDLVQKALKLVSKEFEGGELEALEGFFDYYPGYEGKLIASMMIAQEIAKRVGGIAMMEYD